MTGDRSSRLAARRAALISATLASFLTPFMGSATNVALPSIGQSFPWTPCCWAGCQPPICWLRPCSWSPLAGSPISTAENGSLPTARLSLPWLPVLPGWPTPATMCWHARVLQGMGSAMIFGTGVAILTSVFPPRRRGRVLGINVAAVYVGLSMGPFIGGFLTQNLGWRSIFLLGRPAGPDRHRLCGLAAERRVGRGARRAL